MNDTIFKLDNVIQNYIWGSKSAIGDLFGIENPTNEPQAEIWMGAHPNGCSKVAKTGQLLSELIQSNPTAILGEYTTQRYGELPYLFKVLSAAKPLSVQVHPSREKAQAGFAKENEQGIALDAPNRNYKDANHKPELVYALTFYKAMNGFREIEHIIALFEAANIRSLEDELASLKCTPNAIGLGQFFSDVMTLSGEKKQAALSELKQAVLVTPTTMMARSAFQLVSEFYQDYPDDIGLFSPLLLNVVELAPGEAMFLHAETPHAYVEGTGLEIMANSDNVLRAGLTPKFMDVDELMANTTFESVLEQDIKLDAYKMGNKIGFPIPVDDFGFEVMESTDSIVSQYVRGAEIVFCIKGSVLLESGDQSLKLVAGESAFICHDAKVYQYQGNGTLARAFN